VEVCAPPTASAVEKKAMSDCAVKFEDQRLAALYEYDVLDTAPEESFDRITRLVKLTMGTSIAVVSLVDRDRQWFKSRQGTETTETARDISFCTHTIQKDETLVVTNALEDPRFRDSPLVTCENGIRMYVGVPLKTPGGFNIGALCAIDSKPGTVSSAQIDVMHDLARLVVDELELRKLAAIDSLTGAMTGRTFSREAKKEVMRARRHGRDLGCIMFDLDHFKNINDSHGHAAGDLVLRSVASICQGELRSADLYGRVGGEEFAVILPETSLAGAVEIAERLRAKFAAATMSAGSTEIKITASFGVTAILEADREFESMLKRADGALYQAKNGGRNRVVSADRASQAQDLPAVA
jgi:diguanylate cyclase (GGDEF)-like protein